MEQAFKKFGLLGLAGTAALYATYKIFQSTTDRIYKEIITEQNKKNQEKPVLKPEKKRTRVRSFPKKKFAYDDTDKIEASTGTATEDFNGPHSRIRHSKTLPKFLSEEDISDQEPGTHRVIETYDDKLFFSLLNKVSPEN